MGDEQLCHFAFKVCVVGDQGVGKSTLLQVNEKASPFGSFGVNFQIKFYEVNGLTYFVQYWDCPGARRHLPLTARYAAGAAGAIVVFDLSRRATFDHVEDWINQVDTNGPLPKVLVGNKGDSERQEVTEKQAKMMADKYGMQYLTAESISRRGVSQVFQAIFSEVAKQIPDPQCPRPSLLLGTGIRIGRKVTDNPAFAQAIYSTPTVTAAVDGGFMALRGAGERGRVEDDGGDMRPMPPRQQQAPVRQRQEPIQQPVTSGGFFAP